MIKGTALALAAAIWLPERVQEEPFLWQDLLH